MSIVPTNWRPRTIRGIIVALLNEFTGMTVENFQTGQGSNGVIVTEHPVPLKLGPMNEFHQIRKRIEEGKQYYAPLPAMGLTWDSVNFAGDRARGLNDLRKFYNETLALSDVDEFLTNLNPRPYDFSFTLEIRTESLNHLTQLFEQILPHFDPSRYLRVKEFSFLNIERNLKLILDGISNDFLIEMGEENHRYLRAQLQMTVQGYMYRFSNNAGNIGGFDLAKVIKEIRTRYYVQTSAANLSADAGRNTSGWDSSAAFPASWDLSGSVSGADGEFDYYSTIII